MATHPLIHAGKWLLSDLLSTLAFVAIFAVSHSVYVAAGAAIGLGLGQICYLKWRGRSIDPIQWLSVGLVIVFSGATLLTRNPLFVMLKPTLIYAAIGAVMLRRGWMNRYMPPSVLARAADVTTFFGFVWAGLMFATAGANLAVAAVASPAVWGWFIGVFPIASKLMLVAIQYVSVRVIVRRRIRRHAAVEERKKALLF